MQRVLHLLCVANLRFDGVQVLGIRQDVALGDRLHSGDGHLDAQVMLARLVLLVALQCSFLEEK